jgi:RHS repeat-associated protein
MRLWTRATACAVVFTVFATSAPALAKPVDADPGAPGVQAERNIQGGPVKVAPLPPMAMPAATAERPVWPAAEKSEVAVAAAPRQAGKSPVSVAGRSAAVVAVETFGQDVSAKAGVAGVVMKVSPTAVSRGNADPVSVRLDYRRFAQAYGGDYGSRLTFRRYPACLLATPDRPECRTGTFVPSKNDAKRRELSAEVAVDGTLLVAAAGNSGSGGSYSATSLAPSGSWSAGDSSGDFTYSMPLTMPAAPGGPAPQLALAYSAGSVDGRTSATNNQASWVGDGWELSTGGFIERTFRSCSEDPGNQGDLQTGDLCWKDEKYTISLGGMSGKLIKDKNTGKLRPEKDDGSRIEKVGNPAGGYVPGEHWKVTTLDGTQYFLGLNDIGTGRATNSVLTEPVYGNNAGEPCNKAAFADSACTQAYRWSVDKVVDPRGNVMVFYYDKELNYYKRGGFHGSNVPYDAWGRLARIEWGLRVEDLSAKAPAQVVFEVAERCLPTGAITCAPEQLNKDTASSWPDVPFDRICAAGEDCTMRFSPAFFTRKRLTRVLTQSLKPDGTGYADVDSWTLRQEFPPTGDGMPQSLWLSGVQRTGHVGGTAKVPEIVFSGVAMDNRVDALEGLLPITRYRLTRIVGEAGSLTEVRYSDRDCVRGSRMPAKGAGNTMRCYPVFWTPPGSQEPIEDWFHKYVVTNVTEDARTGGPSMVKTEFQYIGGGAWHYDDNDLAEAKYRDWSEWRGYERVRTVKGDPSGPQTVSETLYLRGMDGDNGRDVWVTDGDGGRIEDADELAGFTRESLLFSGGKVVSAGVNHPKIIETANDGTDRATMVRPEWTAERSLQESGTWRRTRSSSAYNDLGQAVQVETEGDTASAGDESCSKTTYARNEDKWMLALASAVRTIAKPCSAWPGTDDDVVTDVKSAYDGQAENAAPTRGIVTSSSRWIGPNSYQKVSTAKADQYGRTIESTDADGGKTTVSYTPATGNPQTVTTVNRAGWETKSLLDTARGAALTEIGLTGERSDLEYDPLGRLVKVWQPGRAKADGKSPNAEYSYEYRSDAPTVVTSKSITEEETYKVSYDLLDGMLRPRQSQTPSPIGGRILTDTFYDSRGNTFASNAAYYNSDAPSTVLFGAFDNAVPNQTLIEFDDLGRPLETIQRKMNVEQWRTKTRYAGDTTYTTPPQGDTATAVIKDALGQVAERREYQDRSATGLYPATAAYDSTKYEYNYKGLLSTVTDSAGNKWQSGYDRLGRKNWSSDPDTGATTYEYDDMDKLVSTKDARGRKLVYEYDDLDRQIRTLEEAPSGARAKLTETVYDTLRRGLVTSTTRYVDGREYVNRVDRYDALNRPDITSVVIPADEGKLAGTYTFRSSFSAVTGQLLSEEMPAVGGLEAETVFHTYNSAGLPATTYGKDTYASESLYSAYGETLRVTMGVSPNKVWMANTYSEGVRRLENSTVKTGGEPGTVESSRDFTYDPAGNVTKLVENASQAAETQCFSYDHLRRLGSAWTPTAGDCGAAKDVNKLGGPAPYWYDFGYDKIGNRKTQVQHSSAGDVTETYDVPASGGRQPHSLTAVNRTGPTGTAKDEFTYDESGNLKTRKISGNTQTLEWNAEGRVSKVTEADGKASEYVYDASGARLLKKEPNATVLYLPGHEVILARSGTLTAKRYYDHGDGTIAVRGSVSGLQWMFGDQNGTDDLAIDAGNLWAQRQHTDPFGNARGAVSKWWPDDKGLAGGTRDATGLTSMGAREYDPRTGRFASVDPVMDSADSQQIHGYAYASNNPVTSNDASGAFSCGPDGVLCGRLPYMFDKPDPNDSPAKQRETLERSNRQYERERATFLAERRYHNEVQSQAGRRAAQELGISEEEQRRLEEDAASKKGFWDVMKEEIPDIIGDLTGFNDLRDCFTKGDLWACVGIIPWGKVFKLIGSAKKIFKAVRKALKWEERVEEARNSLRRITSLTEKYVREGMEKLDDIRKKAVDDVMAKCKLHSFPAGTRVLLADGTSRPIEQVQVGDTVQAADPETGRIEARPVVATWVHENEPNRTELTIDTDGSAGPATAAIEATDWHPIWVADLKAWVPILDVQVGSWLQTSSGTWVQVTAVRHTVSGGQAYDLTVDEIHSYHVLLDAVSVLVHNCSNVLSNDDGVDNVATLAAHEEGAAFSGVYDPDTERFRAHRNVPERGPDSPPDVVNRTGGHGQVNFEHFGMSRNTVGFTIFKERDGLSIGWMSRSVNRRNHGNPLAPMEHRQGIIDAVAEATGLPVWAR